MDLDPLQAEPPPLGRLRFHTSQGPVEIELWSKETPRTCRNIIQLSLEGFYDGLPFHRLVADFIVQTGDPTGTGRGGTSIYAPLLPDGTAPDGRDPTRSDEGYFPDEFHPRLRFNKRGMLGMANANAPNTNQSQFFITLAPAPELQGKHTLFGRVAGASMYTLLALLEGVETDDEGHPVPRDKAPRIDRVEVVDNPFDDLVPRVSQAAKRAEQEKERAQAKAQRKAQRKAEERAQLKAQTKKRKVLLSFGDEEEDQSASVPFAKGKKAKSAASEEPVKVDKSRLAAPGLVDAPEPSKPSPSPSAPPAQIDSPSPAPPVPTETPAPQGSPVHPSPSPAVADQDLEDMEAMLLGRRKGREPSPAAPKALEDKKKRKAPVETARSWLAEQKAQYSKSKPKDVDVLARLNSFRDKLKRAEEADAGKSPTNNPEDEDEDVEELDPEMREYGSSSDEEPDKERKNKTGWADLLGHKFEDTKHTASQDRLQAGDYAVLDPRGEEGGEGDGLDPRSGGKDPTRSRAREEKHRHAWARQVRQDEDAEVMRLNEERRYAERSGMTWGRSAPSGPSVDSRSRRDSPPRTHRRGERDERSGPSRSDRGPARESGSTRRGPRSDRPREFGRPSSYGGRRGDDLDRRAPSRPSK